MTRLFLSNDTSALAAGAARLAKAWERAPGVELVRTSSRGAFFLEPMVERAMPEGRVAWCNVQSEQLPQILAGSGGIPTDSIPFLSAQTRLTFANFGMTQPLSLQEYVAHGGMTGLQRASELSPEAIIGQLKTSGLAGPGRRGLPGLDQVADRPGDCRGPQVCGGERR